MVFRCHSRKSRSFKQLLLYMNTPQERGKRPVFHNLETSQNNLVKIANEFMRHSGYIKPRENGVFLYHHVLSLSSYDKEKVTEQVLNNIARKYLELCAPEAKAYALAQFNTDNPHIHILISANKLESSEKIRISKKDFFSMRREMDKYLANKYPELEQSLIFDREISRKKDLSTEEEMKVTWYEQERVKRLKAANKEVTPSKKQMVRNTLLTAFTVAMDSKQFVNLLKEEGLTLYKRGQNLGVIDREGMKYRFSTLGLEEILRKTLYQWAAMPGRTAEEQRIEFERVERKIAQWGFKEDIELALKEQPSDLDLIFKEKRRRKRERGIRRRRILR